MIPTARRLTMVQLEDRATPATFTVTTILDSGDNEAPTAGSLRAAILDANRTLGADTIAFSISGGGVQPIAVTTTLPDINEAVTIDGSTQPGFAGTPVVRLTGTGAGTGVNGLTFANHTGSTVRALNIAGFNGAGIRIIGGGSHKIVNSLIGTTQNGTEADGNGTGILITDSELNTIGGGSTNTNYISGNRGDGVQILNSSQNVVTGNTIGAARNDISPLGNGGNGIAIGASSTGTQIGGTAPGSGNIIVSNQKAGVRIVGASTLGTSVVGNRIGLDSSGNKQANANEGIAIEDGVGSGPLPAGRMVSDTATNIRNNTIQQNSGDGIAVRDTSRSVRILDNSIDLNGGLGISVATTANNSLKAPTITGVDLPPGGGSTVVVAVTGLPNTAYLVTVYGVDQPDPSGNGEGVVQSASTTVTTNATGTATKNVTVIGAGNRAFFTATVTNTTTGDTSAFSNAKMRPILGGLSLQMVGVGAGSGLSSVNLFDVGGSTVGTVQSIFASSFTGGVRTALADFNMDGVLDVVAGTGPGAATQVRIIDPATGSELFRVDPFEAAFTGGVYVAAGDLTGDGSPELIITPDEGGGPRVDVYSKSGSTFVKIAGFFGIDDPNFRGGARAATGDLNKDGAADLIVAAGFGGGPRVAAFNGKTVASNSPVKLFGDFFVFEQSLRNGAFIAAGDINGDGFADLVTGGGPGGAPRVTVFDGQSLLSNQYQTRANFFAGNTNSRGGVRVAARDLGQDALAEIITGDGPGSGTMRIYNGASFASNGSPAPQLTLDVVPNSPGGIFVG